VCSACGEKKFDPKQLSARNFIHQSIDIFTHFESKVLKSIWLIIRKPGFLTKENIRGVRVPYAKPMQLFIIVNVVFYFSVSYLHRSDYIPAAFDNNSSPISQRPFLNWTRPVDKGIVSGIDSLRANKFRHYIARGSVGASYYVYKSSYDTALLNNSQLLTPENKEKKMLAFLNIYDQKVSVYSKTLIFLLIPVFALLLYFFFYKRLKYFGSALILSTHFITFNLLFYVMLVGLSDLPWKWFHSRTFMALPFKAAAVVFYNSYTSDFFTAVLGLYQGYEALHVLALGLWLFLAFRRLFDLPWWQNLLASYFLARIFYILVFCLFKKFLIAFTFCNM
jgi:hypothetical protein